MTPNHAQIYYRRKTMRHVEAFPPGFRMVAGDAKATSAQPLRVDVLELRRRRRRRADEHRADLSRRAPERAPAPRHVPELLGRQEPRQREPPEPRRVPGAGPLPGEVRARAAADLADLPLSDDRCGQRRTLASGGQLSGHADFFNAWRQSDLQALVDGCLNALRHCQRGA